MSITLDLPYHTPVPPSSTEPTQASIEQRALALYTKATAQQETTCAPTTAVYRIGTSYYQAKAVTKKYRITNLDDECKRLQEIANDVEQFHRDCDAFHDICTAKLHNLSIFKPETWKTLFVETIDRLIIFLIGPLFSFGTIRVSDACIQESKESITDTLIEMKRHVSTALQQEKSIKTLDAYSFLTKICPEDTSHLDDVGARLLQEGAYAEASNTLQKFLAAHPNKSTARLQLATALKAESLFDKALLEAEKIPPEEPLLSKIRQLRIECLQGLGKLEEAKQLLRQECAGVHSSTALEQLFEASVKALIASENYDVQEPKRLFHLLDSTKNNLVHGKVETVELDFWIRIITSQEAGIKFIDQMMQATKEIAANEIVARISQAVNALENEIALYNRKKEALENEQYNFLNKELEKTLSSARRTSLAAIIQPSASNGIGLIKKHKALVETVSRLQTLGIKCHSLKTHLERQLLQLTL